MSLETLVIVLVLAVLVASFVLVLLRTRRKPSDPRGTGPVMLTALGIVLAVIGVAVPVLIVVHNATEKPREGPGGLVLTEAQARGRQIFAHTCANCHTLGDTNSVGLVGRNLEALRPSRALVLDAIARGRARGRGQMPKGLLRGPDAEDVASYVSAVAGRAPLPR